MRVRIPFLLIILGMIHYPLCSHLPIPQMTVSSGEAQFNGKEAVLIGDVSIRKGLGQITAHRIAMVPIEGEKTKTRAALFKMSDDVQIQLEGGGCLNCQLAEIDYSKMRGVFLGDRSFPDVVYRHFNSGAEDADSSPLFVVKSLQMSVDLVKEGSLEGQKGRLVVGDIYAQGEVVVSYQQKYSVNAQKAHFQRLISEQVGKASKDNGRFAGWISLTSDSGCHMSTIDGDNVIADSIQVDTNQQKLFLIKPSGTLMMSSDKEKKEGGAGTANKKGLSFNAEELIWYHSKQLLHLKGNVHLAQADAIELKSPHELFLIQAEINGRKTISKVTAPKETDVIFNDAEKGVLHKIHCPGQMVIDHSYCHITLKNDREAAVQEVQGNQVVLENSFGEMFADRVEIDYFCDERRAFPVKVILTGAVRVINRFNGHLQEVGGMLHYAMADRLEYDPIKQEMILSSTDDNRVLFFDKVNNVQMSAPALNINRDKETQKEVVRGIGDVRFTFIERELTQLKQYFQIEDHSKR